MNLLVMALMGLLVFVHAGTAQQSTVSGQVRLADGRPVAGAQVTLFDLADLHQGAVARAMTDESGYFALPLASLGGSALPQEFALGHNYPNPFNPSTVIPYQLPTAGHVRLDVFNVLGQHVATLVDAERQAGFHAAKWNAADQAGQAMAAGVYIYRLTAGGQQQVQRMVLIDGQAGIAAGASSTAVPMSTDAAVREYSLVVSGEGLTTYTDVAFEVRAGVSAVELVVDATLPIASGKRAADEDVPWLLTDDKGKDHFPAWSPDGSQIAFSSSRNGNVDIYVIDSEDSDGSDPRRLTDHGKADKSPAWSPDGSQIAFVSDRDGNDNIYVMNSDGSDPRRLTDHESRDESPAWSPDGSRIAFSSSRDGNDEIYVMDSDGSNPRRLTDHGKADKSPAWSPDGSRIAFSSSRDGNDEIYVMDSDGSNPRRLTHHSARDGSPVWSPDGQHIAFSSSRKGNDEIYVMGRDGSDERPLTDNRRADLSPAWSSDGRIAFSSESERDGNLGIYVMEVDGSETPEPETPEPETPEPETPEPETPTDPVAGGSTGEVQTFSLPGGASMEFVWVEPGVFQMGSNTGRKDESPVHEVEISRGFWLGKYEVTQGQWKAVMDDEPWSGRARVISDSSHPAVIISWDEVQEFIRRINEEAGEELYRLPTEAEWEYACRAGTQTRWSFGDDTSQLKNYAWYFNNTEGAKAVGSRLPNPWGLYDMHGNVWEWVQDWYDEEYYTRSVREDPQGPESGRRRVIRGGHFGHVDGVRSAYRHLHAPESRSYTIGVRLLRIAGD